MERNKQKKKLFGHPDRMFSKTISVCLAKDLGTAYREKAPDTHFKIWQWMLLCFGLLWGYFVASGSGALVKIELPIYFSLKFRKFWVD